MASILEAQEDQAIDYHHSQMNETDLLSSVEQLAIQMGMKTDDLRYFEELSPYLILDGHRSGVKGENSNPFYGYIEGAYFSLKFAILLKKLGCKESTFLIHTLRNYKTQERMANIFGGIQKIGKEFIKQAAEQDIKLQYFGKEVHSEYMLAPLINAAELVTSKNDGFKLNYITNYSEEWGIENIEELADLPQISVVGRFTKGHYSGANLPGKITTSNFIYIQQASISSNWANDELLVLALSLLKSHLSLKGNVGGKVYENDEKDEIFLQREEEAIFQNYNLTYGKVKKRIISFAQEGPFQITC